MAVRMAGSPATRRSSGITLAQRAQHLATLHVQNALGSLGRLWRAPVASLMTIAVIGIALALPVVLHLLVQNAKQLGGRWESAVDLAVYFATTSGPDAADSLAAELRERSEISAVEVVSADAALKEFKALSGFGAALDALTENPLPASLLVRPAAGFDDTESVATLAHELGARDGVDLVQLDTEWVERFHALLDIIRRAVWLAAILLAAGVLLIIGNTIRLDIENRRDEIEVTKLIGATDGFIRRPFLYGGLWYGLGGAVWALLTVQLVLWLLAAPVSRVAGLYGSDFGLTGMGVAAMGWLLLGGALLGLLGSWFAATRHMRRIEPS